MRTPKLRLLSAFLALAMILTMLPVIPAPKAFAADIKKATDENGIEWTYTDNDDNTVTIVKCKGNYRLEDITVPSTLDQKTVTVFGPGYQGGYVSDACPFFGFNDLKSVTLPSTLKKISSRAFFACTLQTIHFDDIQNSQLAYVGDAAFNQAWFTSIELPDSLTEIGESVFMGCQNLSSVKLPSNLKSIGKRAFSMCGTKDDPSKGLTEIDIPDTVTSIGSYAFDQCYALKNVKLPNNAAFTTLSEHVFGNCCSLEGITIPNSVTEIGERAFEYCTKLSSIHVPSSVKTIGNSSFVSCTSLKNVTFDASSCLTEINNSAFSGCSSLKTIALPEGLKTINYNAFQNSALEGEFVLPSTLICIRAGAFDKIHLLTDVKFNNFKSAWDAIWNYNPSSVKNTEDNDAVLNAKYLCYIKFDLNGGKIDHNDSVDTQTVYTQEKLGGATCYGTNKDFVIPADPTKAGCRFTGWTVNGTKVDSIADYTPTNDAIVNDAITFEANYVTAYDVTFDANAEGDTVTNMPDKQTVAEKTAATEPTDAPVRTGYTFDGWYTAADDESGRKYTFETTADADKITKPTTLYAHWTLNTHDVTVKNDENDKNPETRENVEYGTTVTLDPPAERSGWKHTGWNLTVENGKDAPELTGPDSDGKYSFTMPDYDVTATAQWTPKGDLTADDFDFNATDPANVTVTPKSGKTGIGDVTIKYYDENDNELKDENGNPTAPTTPGEYTVKIDVAEGKDYKAAKDLTDKDWKFTIKRVPTADDFIYDKDTGKVTPKDDSGIGKDDYKQKFVDSKGKTVDEKDLDDNGVPKKPGDYTVKVDVTGNEKVDAKNDITGTNPEWKYTVKGYTVTFVNEMGKTEEEKKFTQNADFDGKVEEPKEPRVENYNFVGWYTEPEGGDKFDFTKKTVSGPTTLYAHWRIIKYTVTFDANAGNDKVTDMPEAQTVNAGSLAIKPKTDPQREGYTFDCWMDHSGTTGDKYEFSSPVTGDLELYAKWTKKNTVDPDKDNKKTPSADDFTYDPSTGKVTPKDDSGIGDGDYEQKFVDSDGNTVPKEDLDPDTGLPTKPGDYTVKVDVKGSDKVEKKDDITGTDPEWKYTVPEEPAGKDGAINPASVIVGAGVAVVGGAALGWQAYNLYAELAGYWMLPAGFAFPTTREMLALALWNDADQPAAVNNTKYSDLEEGSESQTAARWAVENELIKPLDDDDTAFGAALPVGPLEVYKAFKAEKAWQKANK